MVIFIIIIKMRISTNSYPFLFLLSSFMNLLKPIKTSNNASSTSDISYIERDVNYLNQQHIMDHSGLIKKNNNHLLDKLLSK